MDQIHEIELEDCPICRGIGTMEDEAGWCVYVSQQAAHLWNIGKVIHTGVGD